MDSPDDSLREKQEASLARPEENLATPSPAVEDGNSSVLSPGTGPPNSAVDPAPESLHQVSSGPAYSTFSKPTKRWIIAMAACASFVSPMTANIYFPALNSIAAD